MYVYLILTVFIYRFYDDFHDLQRKQFGIILATVPLKVVSRKRRRKCTLKSYDRFTNS